MPTFFEKEQLDEIINGNFNRIVEEVDIIINSELYGLHLREEGIEVEQEVEEKNISD